MTVVSDAHLREICNRVLRGFKNETWKQEKKTLRFF